jgi:putative solute:sodium symporter small subunit
MIDWRERKVYWGHTKWQMVATLLPFLIGLVIVPHYADALNTKRILGMPFGFFLLCQGLVVVSVVVTAVWVNRQDAIDRWHGAQEDV